MQSESEKAVEKQVKLVDRFMDEFCKADFESRPVIATGKYDRDELIEALAHEIRLACAVETPELVQAAKEGEIKVSTAERLTHLTEEEQRIALKEHLKNKGRRRNPWKPPTARQWSCTIFGDFMELLQPRFQELINTEIPPHVVEWLHKMNSALQRLLEPI
jgi:hypothetical protein